MRRLSRVVATVVSVAVIGLAAGCGGDNPTPSAAPLNPTTSPTTDTAVPVPEFPAAAKPEDKAGANAFVRHWVAVLNYAGRTGKAELLRELSTPDCVRCAALSDGIDRIYKAGGRISGGGWRVLSMTQYGPTQNRYFVDATIQSSPQSLQQSRDAETTSFPGVERRLRAFVLRYTQQGWRVAELDPSA